MGEKGPQNFPRGKFPRGKIWGFKTPKGAPLKPRGFKTPGFPLWGKRGPKFSRGKFPRGKIWGLNPKRGPFKPRGFKTPGFPLWGKRGPKIFPGENFPGGKFGV
ncbi:hypothetical protein CRG93_26460 [Escherichia sp. E2593]|nr:hypothetical protein CRG93_26460 [Escherichia sp. E2593]